LTKRIFLGMLTPSSNTALEPLTSAMLAGLPEVSAHFGRFKVTEISLDAGALGQFDDVKVLEAARLLADARVDVIAWNGTSAGWLGLDADERLCERITAETGIPATTSTLALYEIMLKSGRTAYGLVTPYLDAIQDKIVANFARHGLTLVAERHLNICVNFDFSEVSETLLETMIREVAQMKPQCIWPSGKASRARSSTARCATWVTPATSASPCGRATSARSPASGAASRWR
jgi:maleate isomerase